MLLRIGLDAVQVWILSCSGAVYFPLPCPRISDILGYAGMGLDSTASNPLKSSLRCKKPLMTEREKTLLQKHQ